MSDAPGLEELIERGVLLPASRRLADVLAAHPPLKLDQPAATAHALAEPRATRA
jgi:hypothetical protein